MAEGVYDGALPPDVPAGRCTLSIRLGTFDTADDADDKPEQRIPTGATLTLTPNVTGPVILPDGTIMVIKGTVLTSDTGEFDFWAIDGMRSSVNPTGWNWTAVLKIDAATQVRFTFSPDSTSTTPLNLGALIPVSDPKTGVATVVGRGVASINVDPDTRHVLFLMSDATTYDAGAIPPGPPGDDGRGIASVTVDPDTRHMILTMSDDTAYDAGAVPPGPKGDDGPPNTLTIGAVAQGEAAASITGESPEQVLNLTLPQGDPGDPGPPNSLTIGTVTQGPAAAQISGTAPSQVLNLTIPPGQPGPANVLTIGTVTTGTAGSNAAATITGTAPNQTLNLTLPKGDPGTGGAGGTALAFLQVDYSIMDGATDPPQTVGDFGAVRFYRPPTVNSGGGLWNADDPSGSSWTVPISGIYLCIGSIRKDGGTPKQVHLNIHDSVNDSPYGVWNDVGGLARQVMQVVRMSQFTAGQRLRLVTYGLGSDLRKASMSIRLVHADT